MPIELYNQGKIILIAKKYFHTNYSAEVKSSPRRISIRVSFLSHANVNTHPKCKESVQISNYPVMLIIRFPTRCFWAQSTVTASYPLISAQRAAGSILESVGAPKRNGRARTGLAPILNSHSSCLRHRTAYAIYTTRKAAFEHN